jgi:hypothetical protein
MRRRIGGESTAPTSNRASHRHDPTTQKEWLPSSVFTDMEPKTDEATKPQQKCGEKSKQIDCCVTSWFAKLPARWYQFGDFAAG